MSSSEPPRKPTEAELKLVADRFKFVGNWGRAISEFERLLEISGYKEDDFSTGLSLNPILIFIPERNVYFLNRNPRSVRRAVPGGRKNEKIIKGMELTGEEIIKLAEEFRSLDLERVFLFKFFEAKKIMTLDPIELQCESKGEEWEIDASTLFNLSSLRDKLKELGFPEEGIRIKRDEKDKERLYILRAALQHFMRYQVPSEEKKHFEAQASASKGDSKSGVEGSTVPHREGPPGGLAWDEAEKDKAKDKEPRTAPEPRTSPRKP